MRPHDVFASFVAFIKSSNGTASAKAARGDAEEAALVPACRNSHTPDSQRRLLTRAVQKEFPNRDREVFMTS
jgi:phage terminase small subunit